MCGSFGSSGSPSTNFTKEHIVNILFSPFPLFEVGLSFSFLSILKGKGEDKNETFFDIGQHPIITDDGICGLLLSGDGFDYRQANGKARVRAPTEG